MLIKTLSDKQSETACLYKLICCVYEIVTATLYINPLTFAVRIFQTILMNSALE